MNVTWQTSFADAFERMDSLVELVKTGVVSTGDRTIRQSDPVTLRMGIESTEHGIELVFEIASLPGAQSSADAPAASESWRGA